MFLSPTGCLLESVKAFFDYEYELPAKDLSLPTISLAAFDPNQTLLTTIVLLP